MRLLVPAAWPDFACNPVLPPMFSPPPHSGQSGVQVCRLLQVQRHTLGLGLRRPRRHKRSRLLVTQDTCPAFREGGSGGRLCGQGLAAATDTAAEPCAPQPPPAPGPRLCSQLEPPVVHILFWQDRILLGNQGVRFYPFRRSWVFLVVPGPLPGPPAGVHSLVSAHGTAHNVDRARPWRITAHCGAAQQVG